MNLWVTILATLLFACAASTPTGGDPNEEMSPEPMAPGLYKVTTLCAGPKGVMVNGKGIPYEVYACVNGVIMLRPTTVAEAPAPSDGPQPSADIP